MKGQLEPVTWGTSLSCATTIIGCWAKVFIKATYRTSSRVIQLGCSCGESRYLRSYTQCHSILHTSYAYSTKDNSYNTHYKPTPAHTQPQMMRLTYRTCKTMLHLLPNFPHGIPEGDNDNDEDSPTELQLQDDNIHAGWALTRCYISGHTSQTGGFVSPPCHTSNKFKNPFQTWQTRANIKRKASNSTQAGTPNV